MKSKQLGCWAEIISRGYVGFIYRAESVQNASGENFSKIKIILLIWGSVPRILQKQYRRRDEGGKCVHFGLRGDPMPAVGMRTVGFSIDSISFFCMLKIFYDTASTQDKC